MKLRNQAIRAFIPKLLIIALMWLAIAELNYQAQHNQWVDHVFQGWVK